MASAALSPCAWLVRNAGKRRGWSQDRATAPGEPEGRGRRFDQDRMQGADLREAGELGGTSRGEGGDGAMLLVYASQGETLRDFQ